MDNSDLTHWTIASVCQQLTASVSEFNANLLLQTAQLGAGIEVDRNTPLKREEARAISLELIKNGGPSFKVGKSIFTALQ